MPLSDSYCGNSHNYPAAVTIVEMGPRDGLQNERTTLPIAAKVNLVNELAKVGLKKIETGAFVSPKWVPQMADSAAVFQQIQRQAGVAYSALTPNLRGYDNAVACRADEVAVFTAASEAFTQKNINCTIAESIERFAPVIAAAKMRGIPVRGYVSCVVGCPYQGDVQPQAVAAVAQTLFDLGCYQISLGDTIGVGTPLQVQRMLQAVVKCVPVEQLAVHFHDTYGQALANILLALQLGVNTIDSSVAGLGGCPYAGHAAGNVGTEDVVYMLNGMGISTGIDLQALAEVGGRISQHLGKVPASRIAKAILAGHVQAHNLALNSRTHGD